ncbi:MAG: Asp23 family, cell envelope-related function [Chloroflexota bacterium]
MSEHPVTGGARVTRRALTDIIRPAVAGSYGVTGFAPRTRLEALLGRLGVAAPGIAVTVGERLEVDLHLTVAFGLPVAEVARQAESAVRYAVRRALERDVDRLSIHIGGMRYGAGSPGSPQSREAAPGPGDDPDGAERPKRRGKRR